jgi:hypothetical protein
VNKLIFLSICALSVPCLAQDQPEVPAGNPVQFPTGNAQWTIDVTYKASSTPAPTAGATPKPTPAASGRIRRIEVTQSDTMERTVTTLDTGKKSESWFQIPLGVLVSTNTPDGSPVCFSGKDRLRIMALATGFEPTAFQWLDRDHFVNFVAYKGQKCLHYKKDVQLSKSQRAYVGGVSGVFEAWVDQEKRLPIALSNEKMTGIYTFAKDPPTEALTMPQPIADELRAYTTPPRMPGT